MLLASSLLTASVVTESSTAAPLSAPRGSNKRPPLQMKTNEVRFQARITQSP